MTIFPETKTLCFVTLNVALEHPNVLKTKTKEFNQLKLILIYESLRFGKKEFIHKVTESLLKWLRKFAGRGSEVSL